MSNVYRIERRELEGGVVQLVCINCGAVTDSTMNGYQVHTQGCAVRVQARMVCTHPSGRTEWLPGALWCGVCGAISQESENGERLWRDNDISDGLRTGDTAISTLFERDSLQLVETT